MQFGKKTMSVVFVILREKVYYFSTNETRDKFLEDPATYLTKDGPLKVCTHISAYINQTIFDTK